jgi:tetratricopeptide (TPR) repeat protein
MEWRQGYKDAIARLDCLDECEAFSPYSRAYYRLIVDCIEHCHDARLTLYSIFLSFLDGELQYHRALREVGMESRASLRNWISFCGHKAAVLHETLARLADLPETSAPAAVVQYLVCAECFLQLGESDLVVTCLQAAMAKGCDHPLVHFSLGYHLYLRAIRCHTTFDTATRFQIIQDPSRFEQECRQAVRVMHHGICDSPYDPQLYWWIGSILENLSATGEARAAFQQVAELDPETYGEVVREKLTRLTTVIPDASSEEERDRLVGMSEITVDEILDSFRHIESVTDLIEQGRSSPSRGLLQGAD